MLFICRIDFVHSTELDLNLLRVFDAIRTTRNITAAAKRLGLTQPSISHALGRLRTFYGDPLFVRTKRAMEPTPRALELASPIAEALAAIRNTVETRRAFEPASSERTFHLAMTAIGQSLYLPKLAAFVAREAPAVNLVIHELSGEALRQRMQSGAVDVAIGPFGGLKTGFFQQRLYVSPFVCILRRQHPRLGARINLEAFLAESHVLVAPPGTGESAVDTALQRLGRERRIALRLPNFHAAARVLATSDMICVMPESLLQGNEMHPRLRSAALPFATEGIAVSQFWHARFDGDAANRWLRSAVVRLFGADR